MKAKGTLREFRVIGRKLPTENEPETPLYRCVSWPRGVAMIIIIAISGWRSLLPMPLWPSLVSGTSWDSWGNLRRPPERSSLWRRSRRGSLFRSRTLESGWDTTPGKPARRGKWCDSFIESFSPGPGPTTCTASTVTSPWVAPSPSATATWGPGTGPGLTASRSSGQKIYNDSSVVSDCSYKLISLFENISINVITLFQVRGCCC